MDSHIYARYAAELQTAYEKQLSAAELDNTVLAYRKLRMSNIQLSLRVMNEAFARGPSVLLGFDFQDFFGTLRHDHLKAAWQRTLGTDKLPEDHFRVFRSVTRYATVDRDELLHTIEPHARPSDRLCSTEQLRTLVRPLINVNVRGSGIPQGLPISACLSNVYMLPFDSAMRARTTELGGVYARYSDDVLLCLPSAAADEVVAWMTSQLCQTGLTLNASKTIRRIYLDGKIHEDREGHLTPSRFDYLGLSYDGADVSLRDKTISKYMQRMAHGVAKAERESRKQGSSRLRFRKALLAKFSHLGDRNFVRGYALKAANRFSLDKVRRQLSRHARILSRRMREADARLISIDCAPTSDPARNTGLG